MVYNIVGEMKGFVSVDSVMNSGTTMKLFFPAEVSTVSVEENDSEGRLSRFSGEGLILVADDEPVMRDMAMQILTEFGFQVITAEDGEECISLFKERKEEIRAVILDMAMPVMSGKEAYLGMQKIDPDVCVILVSGFLQDDRVQEILDLGVCGFVQKPYSVSRFMDELKSVLENVNS
jgi:DNA-binding NtrC family response regulator